MIVEKVSLDRVKARLAGLKRKRNPVDEHKEILEKLEQKKKEDEEASEDEEQFRPTFKSQKRQKTGDE